MLRITLDDSDWDGIPLVVEGKLVGESVAELDRLTALILREGKPLRMDLAGVSFMDDAGVQLVKRLQTLGTQVNNSSMYIGSLIRESKSPD
ncbi:MAG: hypothetical protein HUU46_05500 [Candidatus Hydrogenedentes bacterium]|nr:hypothetical protein [Candidatus Hydrogenedentota bacterium]